MRNSTESSFLNVDLELTGGVELDQLLGCLSSATCVLRDSSAAGERIVWLELALEMPDVDSTLVRFVELVAGLPAEVRAVWDCCQDRCLNVGVQAGTKRGGTAFRIEAATVAALAGISARLELTVYASQSESGPSASQ